MAAAGVLTLGLGGCAADQEVAPTGTDVAVSTEASVGAVSPTEAASGSTDAAAKTDAPANTNASAATEARNVTANLREPAAGDCPAADGSQGQKRKFDGEQPRCIDVTKKYKVTMETTKGTMTFELDPTNAPRTVNNFVTLAGFKYFDGISFHRVVRGFVIQGGDPEGTGGGGPGYSFGDELPRAGEYKVGSLAMANAGANTNGSQFFIITGAAGAALPPSYSLFGKLTSGEDVMKAIDLLGPDGADGPPSEPVSMIRVTAEAVEK